MQRHINESRERDSSTETWVPMAALPSLDARLRLREAFTAIADTPTWCCVPLLPSLEAVMRLCATSDRFMDTRSQDLMTCSRCCATHISCEETQTSLRVTPGPMRTAATQAEATRMANEGTANRSQDALNPMQVIPMPCEGTFDGSRVPLTRCCVTSCSAQATESTSEGTLTSLQGVSIPH